MAHRRPPPGCDARTPRTSAAILSPARPPTQTAFSSSRRPGAWGQNALSESRLDPEIANVVAARAAEVSYRVLLIKRPGRAAVEPQRAWAVVDSTPGAERTTWGSYASDRELLDIPLDCLLTRGARRHPRRRSTSSAPMGATMRAVRFAAGRSRPSSPRHRPGPGLGVLPPRRRSVRTRTCSCFRTGSPTAESSRPARSTSSPPRSAGEVVVDLLRGRSVFRPPVQAAQHFARIATWQRPDRRSRRRSAGTRRSRATSASTSSTPASRLTVTVRPHRRRRGRPPHVQGHAPAPSPDLHPARESSFMTDGERCVRRRRRERARARPGSSSRTRRGSPRPSARPRSAFSASRLSRAGSRLADLVDHGDHAREVVGDHRRLAVPQDLRHRAAAHRDDGRAAGERLDHDEAERLLPLDRHDQRVRSASSSHFSSWSTSPT